MWSWLNYRPILTDRAGSPYALASSSLYRILDCEIFGYSAVHTAGSVEIIIIIIRAIKPVANANIHATQFKYQYQVPHITTAEINVGHVTLNRDVGMHLSASWKPVLKLIASY